MYTRPGARNLNFNNRPFNDQCVLNLDCFVFILLNHLLKKILYELFLFYGKMNNEILL